VPSVIVDSQPIQQHLHPAANEILVLRPCYEMRVVAVQTFDRIEVVDTSDADIPQSLRPNKVSEGKTYRQGKGNGVDSKHTYTCTL
jgi:hypothetical protein